MNDKVPCSRETIPLVPIYETTRRHISEDIFVVTAMENLRSHEVTSLILYMFVNAGCLLVPLTITCTVLQQPFVETFSIAYCQCSLFSKKNPIIRILCISGWLAVPINPDKCSSTVLTKLYRLLRCQRST